MADRSVDDPADGVDGPVGRRLWSRADAVLPGGGIYLTRSADFAGRGVLPGFIVAADGCRVTDADGRTYLDLLGANGPNLLGYRHPEVEAAVDEQRARLTSGSLFPPALVEVVEALVDRFPPMTWGVVSKNGSEVVSLGVRVARQHTQRRRVIAFERAYHGNDPELATAPPPGPLTERTRDVDRLPWNDADALDDHLRSHGDDVAAVLLNPLDQNPRRSTLDASAEFVAAIDAGRDRHGVLVVFDDVRHGFRLHPHGSSHRLGIRPDLVAFGKALGNGHSISALLGTADVRRAARKVLYTSTYMFEAPPMRAAIATLQVYDRDGVFDHMVERGEQLRSGIMAAATASGHEIDYSGPVTMPTMLFVDDPDGDRQRRFARAAAERGAILHPFLNWFLSGAHSSTDVDEIVGIAGDAFAATAP